MTTISPERLAKVFVDVSDTLVADFDLIEFLHLVTSHTAELANAAAAGLLLADHGGHLQFMAASSEEARLLELFQVQAAEGPCQDAFHTRTATAHADLTTATDIWPAFAPRALEAGYRSVLALPLRLRDNVIGALNLFSMSTGSLEPDDVRIVQALADVATIGILQERTIRSGEVATEQLQSALNSRVAIEQAKGAIAQMYKVDVDEAFRLLRNYARHNQLRLLDVAHALIAEPATYPDLRDNSIS